MGCLCLVAPFRPFAAELGLGSIEVERGLASPAPRALRRAQCRERGCGASFAARTGLPSTTTGSPGLHSARPDARLGAGRRARQTALARVFRAAAAIAEEVGSHCRAG